MIRRFQELRRRRARRRFIDSASRLVSAVGFAHEAGIVLCPADDRTILRKVFVRGGRSEFVVLERAVSTMRGRGLSAEGTFLDIGANLGTTTLAALRFHGFSNVIAVEPDPANTRFLRAAVALNGLDQDVTVVEAAATDYVGRTAFAEAATGPLGRKSGRGRLRPDGERSVAAVTLDALAERGLYDPNDVGLVWLDVQGAEALALRGAERLVGARVPVVAAVRARRLAALDSLDAFRNLVKMNFRTLVDLRTPNLKPGWVPAERPASDVDSVLARDESTDLLLLP